MILQMAPPTDNFTVQTVRGDVKSIWEVLQTNNRAESAIESFIKQ